MVVHMLQNSPQSQLANVIYYPSQSQAGVHCVSRRNSYAQPCNTPTPTSATATFHWEWDDAARHRGQNSTHYVAPAPPRSCDMDDDMEEEQAVEDLLYAHTPNQIQPAAVTLPRRQQPPKFRPASGPQQYQQQQQPFSSALSPQSPPLGSPMLYEATPGQSASSHFANTDPFYLAAVQNSSPSLASTTSSFFAQANSPFNLNLSAQQRHHALELESRTVLVGAGQSR